LDNLTQQILSQIALAPVWPSGALTDRLSYENRIQALKHLVEIHSDQFQNEFVSEAVSAKVDELRKALERHRDTRNKLTHWVIFRHDDNTVTALRLTTRLAKPGREDCASYTLRQLDDYIAAINAMIEQAENLIPLLPAAPDPFGRR